MLAKTLDYEGCKWQYQKHHPFMSLTILILDCWQREYDKRPYQHLNISKAFFETRMGRPFSDEDWKVLIEFMGKRKLASVKVSCICMPNLQEVNIRESLVRNLLNVNSVELKGVSLPISFLLELTKQITASKLRKLELCENVLTYNHLLLLRGILIKSCTLTYLGIANCHITDNTFPILADGIYKSKSIKRLDISRPTPMLAVSIFESVKFMNTLSQLIWQNKLTELHLRQCNLNGHDMKPLSEYLSLKDSRLIHLNLSSNNISSHGAEDLFTALAKSKTLRILNLNSCNLGTKGGLVIARYISYTNLRSLDIAHNQIGSEATYELLNALKKPSELEVLKMYGNQFSTESATVLKRLLKAKVIAQSGVDCTYTWNHCSDKLCVIPYLTSGRLFT